MRMRDSEKRREYHRRMKMKERLREKEVKIKEDN